MSKPYMPSNGTEGDGFMEIFCSRCSRDNEEEEEFCDILTNALIGEQPPEWIIEGGKPVCTAFVRRGE